MKLFIYSTLDETSRRRLLKELPAAITPVFKDDLPEDQVSDAFRSAEILMGNPPLEWFEGLPNRLALWQLDSAGFEKYQHVQVAAPVANMGDFFARPCAETMVGGILAFYRYLHVLVRSQEKKQWLGSSIRHSLDLLGTKKVIILGAGSIGLTIKQMLLGFGCQIKMTARRNPVAEIHSFDELLEALPETDLVINTLPGALEKYVSSEFIQAMKTGSLYASVGRGNTTDEKALTDALQTGKLAGAVLDVTEQEPLPEASPLWEMQNVILTQHSGGGYIGESEGKVRQLLSNVNRLLQGKDIENQVNLSQGY